METTRPSNLLPPHGLSNKVPRDRALLQHQKGPVHKAGIEKLPVEIMEVVLKDLAKDEILSLRCMSRSLDVLTWHWVAKHYFTTVRVPLSHEGLLRISSFITAASDFRDTFTKLELDAGINFPSDDDDPPRPTKKQRVQLARQAQRAAEAAEAAEAAKKAQEQSRDVDTIDTTPHGAPLTISAGNLAYADPTYLKPPRRCRGPVLPTASLKNSETHRGRLYGRRVIYKCLELLPSINDITICHRVDGVKQRERGKWVRDHRTASAEAEALLVTLANRPVPLKRLCIDVSRFDRDWSEGLMMLANLHNIPEKKLAKLETSFKNLEHFSISLDTNTLDGVDDEAYDVLPKLLRLMPNLLSLEIAFSRRTRRTHPTVQLRKLAQHMQRLEKLQSLRFFQGRIEIESFRRIVRRHLGTLQQLEVEHVRIFDKYTPGVPNESSDWTLIVEKMKENSVLDLNNPRDMRCEHNDPGLMRTLVMHRKTGQEQVKE